MARHQPGRDRGQAAILLVFLVVGLTSLILSGVAQVGVAVRDRARAESAADAAALAGLAGGREGAGRDSATRIASANGASLVSWTAGPDPYRVTVVVRVGDAVATASATDEP